MKRMFTVFATKPDPASAEISKAVGRAVRTLEFPVGVAFSRDNGSTFRINLDAIPIDFDGKLIIHTDRPLSEMKED
jgi:hypothetical protein